MKCNPVCGMEAVILSQHKILPTGIVKPGTCCFINNLYDIDGYNSVLRLLYVDVYKKGHGSNYLLRRLVLPLTIRNGNISITIAKITILKEYTSLNGNPYKIAAFMQSILNRNMYHKFSISACKRAFNLVGQPYFDKTPFIVNDRQSNHIKLKNSLMTFVAEAVMSNKDTVNAPYLCRLIRAAMSNHRILNRELKTNKSIFTDNEHVILNVMREAKYRLLSLAGYGLVNMSNAVMSKYKDAYMADYVKLKSFEHRSRGE